MRNGDVIDEAFITKLRTRISSAPGYMVVWALYPSVHAYINAVEALVKVDGMYEVRVYATKLPKDTALRLLITKEP